MRVVDRQQLDLVEVGHLLQRRYALQDVFAILGAELGDAEVFGRIRGRVLRGGDPIAESSHAAEIRDELKPRPVPGEQEGA